MNICVSNLAWDEQDAMFEFLQNNSISRVESVFTKIKDWKHLKESDILAYKNKLQQYNLTAYSAQSLFYNVPCKLDDIEQILNHFERLLNYSDILSTKVLVFGSPSLRKQSGDWKQTLRRIFRVLDIMLAGSDIKVIIEPNAKYYGGEFFHTVSEIVEFIDDNEFDNIGTMIDTHNLALEGEDPCDVLQKHHNHIHHIHVSEHKLGPITDSELHRKFANVLKTYTGVVTYEALSCPTIQEDILKFKSIYSS